MLGPAQAGPSWAQASAQAAPPATARAQAGPSRAQGEAQAGFKRRRAQARPSVAQGLPQAFVGLCRLARGIARVMGCCHASSRSGWGPNRSSGLTDGKLASFRLQASREQSGPSGCRGAESPCPILVFVPFPAQARPKLGASTAQAKTPQVAPPPGRPGRTPKSYETILSVLHAGFPAVSVQ